LKRDTDDFVLGVTEVSGDHLNDAIVIDVHRHLDDGLPTRRGGQLRQLQLTKMDVLIAQQPMTHVELGEVTLVNQPAEKRSNRLTATLSSAVL